jgi:Flp pilus assembly CpaE family ATPase
MTVTYKFVSRRDRQAIAGLAPPAAPARGEAPETGAPAPAPADLPGPGHQTEDPAPEPREAKGSDLVAGGPANLPVKWTPAQSRLTLVAKARGGAGATSVAVNLAVELQRKRGLFRGAAPRRVAIVDLDVQFGTVASFLDLEDRGGMLELLRLPAEPDAHAVRNALLSHPSGLKVLAAPRAAIPLEALDAERVDAIFAALMSEFDHVVVDLPPALMTWMEPLLRRAAQVLMVSDLTVPSVASARRVIDLMREDNPELPVEVLISRETRPMFRRRIHREASQALGLPLVHWLPDEPKLCRMALDRGEPVAVLAPRSPWARAIRQVAASIDARPGQASGT